jgi:hypothetical protein
VFSERIFYGAGLSGEMPVIPALRRQRQEDLEFKTNLG